MSTSQAPSQATVWRASLLAALPVATSTFLGLLLLSLKPGGLSSWDPWRAPVIVLCGLSHSVQLPAMAFAARALRWHADYASFELNRRIAIVLQWTLPASMLVLLVVLLRHFEAATTTALGQHLVCFWLGQLLLAARRHIDQRELAFQHRRREIVFLVTGLGWLTSLHAVEVASTQLGAELCAVFGCLLGARTVLQVSFYRAAWPRHLKLQAVGLLVLLTTQTVVYLRYALLLLEGSAS